MDFYWKKIKTNKTTSADNVTNVIDEIGSKYVDMQPIIQESGEDITTAQRKISDIRADVESLQRLEASANDLEQERIKEICTKLKELLASITENLIKPPIQESDTVQVPQNKISLTEMEEKLKSMRQKRLDRLSVFVTEQSKLSIERTSQGSEMEEAIKSMQQKGVEKKPSFKSLLSENILQRKGKLTIKEEENDIPDTPKLNRNRSSESPDKSKNISKPSSRIRFINKFNCTTTPSIGSSNEDLTKETDDMKFYKPVYAKSKSIDNDVPFSSDEKQQFNRNSLGKENQVKETGDISRDKELENYNPLLSPIGKQRKAIYMYENESKFLENIHNEDIPGETRNETVRVYENKGIVAKSDSEKHPLTSFRINKSDSAGKADNEKGKDDNIIENNNTKYLLAVSRSRTTSKSEPHILSKLANETKVTTITVLENKNSNALKEPKKAAFSLSTFGKLNTENDFSNNKKLNVTNAYKNNVVSNYKSENIKQDKRVVAKNIQENNDTISKPEENVGHIRQVFESKVSIAESEIGDKENKHKFLKQVPTHKNLNPIETRINKREKPSKLFIDNERDFHSKVNGSSSDPICVPRSPVPLPRKLNGERVLKKLQRNWDTLNEITENDSDVDSEEIEDIKKTFEEANALLEQYKTKMKKLHSKTKYSKCGEKLSEINAELGDVESDIRSFRGLRRDSSYKQLSSRMSNYFLEASKIKNNKIEVANEKKVMLNRIEIGINMLESRAARNEAMLMEILQSQVRSIGTNCLNITAV